MNDCMCLVVLTTLLLQCAVPENIHTPPTEGIGISSGGGGEGVHKPLPPKFKEMYEA